MEFTRLADVEVVETATDVDKVLIEQNGEIKRVPKTEVGGKGGGNTLVLTHAGITDPSVTDPIFSANMTLTEAIEAFNKQELIGGVMYFASPDGPMCGQLNIVNMTAMAGFEILILMCEMMDLELFWTEAGISAEPPM